MKMLKLPNGEYIRADTITAIRTVTGERGNCVVIGCRDNQERDALADFIAKECAK